MNIDTFKQLRWGMNITWGAFSAFEKGENVLFSERMPVAEYTERVAKWRPADYEPQAWVKLAKQAGMKYLMLTARHVDGFCLFESKVNPFNAVRTGPRRDLVREFIDACKKENLPFGFYFSLADVRSQAYFDGPQKNPKAWANYLKTTYAQLQELLTNYGPIDIIWYDGGWPFQSLRDMSDYYFGGGWPYQGADWNVNELNQLIHSLQPDILIQNPSIVVGYPPVEGTINKFAGWFGDRWPDCYYGGKETIETGITLNRTWGFNRSDRKWKSLEEIIRNWLWRGGTYSSGGNYCLNVGPDKNGKIPPEATAIIKQAGAWFTRIFDAMPTDVTCGHMSAYGRLFLSVKKRKVFCFFVNGPDKGDAELNLRALFYWLDRADPTLASQKTRTIKRAYPLADNEQFKFKCGPGNMLHLKGLNQGPHDCCPVVVIEY